MKNVKLLFSALVVAFAILGLTKAISYDIALPVAITFLAVIMFINSKEYKANGQKKFSLHFFLLGIFLLIVAAYNVISKIWGI